MATSASITSIPSTSSSSLKPEGEFPSPLLFFSLLQPLAQSTGLLERPEVILGRDFGGCGKLGKWELEGQEWLLLEKGCRVGCLPAGHIYKPGEGKKKRK